MKHASVLLPGMILLATVVIAAAAPAIPAGITAAVTDPARPQADAKRDEARKPARMLMFAGVHPGSVVVDLLPGGGYFTRIFAKAVEPNGRVYAYVSDQSDTRLKAQGKDPDNQMADLKAKYPNLGVLHGPLAGFVTPEPVDIVWTSLNYHDMHNKSFGLDVSQLNKAIFKSLKPGGIYVVVDHAAAPDAPDDVTETLHRIKESTAKREVEAAGFKLVVEGQDIANPADDRTQKVFDVERRGGITSQFMLKFQKPRR